MEDRKCRESRGVIVHISSGVELEVEGSEITKRSGGGKEETDWLEDRSGAALLLLCCLSMEPQAKEVI